MFALVIILSFVFGQIIWAGPVSASGLSDGNIGGYFHIAGKKDKDKDKDKEPDPIEEPIEDEYTEVSGEIGADATWTLAASPYIVTGNVQVVKKKTLTIEAGVTVRFNQSTSLNIAGELIAVGTAEQPIYFTSNQDDPQAGDWNNIEFMTDAEGAKFNHDGSYKSGSIIKNSVIQYGGNNDTDVISILGDAPLIENNLIANGRHGIFNEGKDAVIRGNTIQDNSYNGIINSKNGVVIEDNIISNNGWYGIFSDGNNCVIENNTVTDNGLGGIYVHSGNNNAVSGNVVGNNDVFGIGVAGNNATVENNYVRGDNGRAIQFLGGHNIVIVDNTITDETVDDSYTDDSDYVVITENSAQESQGDSITIEWITSHPATSRVLYDTVSHPNPIEEVAPNYGYANSTIEDATLVTEHAVTISGLTPGTTYYTRAVSHGSPEMIGAEIIIATTIPDPVPAATPSSGGGGLVLIDTSPPTAPSGGFKIIINDGQAKTASRQVKLILDGGNEAKFLAISNNADFAGAIREDYVTAKDWTLTAGDGLKTVYARFYSQNGYATPAIADNITLDANYSAVVPQVLSMKIYLVDELIAATRYGQRSQKVRELQSGLKDLGFFKYYITGYYGPITRAAVEAHLVAKKQSGAAEDISETSKIDQLIASLKFGAWSDEVKQLQAELGKLNLFELQPTGFYGPITRASVKAYSVLK